MAGEADIIQVQMIVTIVPRETRVAGLPVTTREEVTAMQEIRANIATRGCTMKTTDRMKAVRVADMIMTGVATMDTKTVAGVEAHLITTGAPRTIVEAVHKVLMEMKGILP